MSRIVIVLLYSYRNCECYVQHLCCYRIYYIHISFRNISTSLVLGQLLFHHSRCYYPYSSDSWILLLYTCVRSRIPFVPRISRLRCSSLVIRAELMIALRPSCSHSCERRYHGTVIHENNVVIGRSAC
jgi:hypothetical protein